jgi:Holliday junction DNA helicase RuvA
MIAMLRGRVALRTEDWLVLDVSGVGYRVWVPAPVLREATDDIELTLHVATIVREDSLLLYGFASAAERQVFYLLRDVNGIGSSKALALLSHLPLPALADAVARGNRAVLQAVPGIGAKIAERLCLELRATLPRAALAGAPGPRLRLIGDDDPLPLALARLDYKRSEIDAVMGSREVPQPGEESLEGRLKVAIRVLARMV